MYENAGGYVFGGVAVGSLISAGLGYVGFCDRETELLERNGRLI